MSTRTVEVAPDRDALVESTADELFRLVTRAASAGRVDVALTGGGVGIAILAALRRRADELPVEALQLWWGDERWLPAGHAERNDHQARTALLDEVPIPAAHIHPFPAADAGLTLAAARERYLDELREAGLVGGERRFDLVLLGVGEDGHVASLFPGRSAVRDEAETVLAVRDSPKPPPERLSLSLPLINTAERVWLVAAGRGKTDAIARALGPADAAACPASAVRARGETVLRLDPEAAGGLKG